MKSTKNDYESPINEQFWENEFSKMRFGSTRPTEMEFLLFYLFYFVNNDFDKSIFDLTNKYSISETKANKFLLEIERRYKKEKLTSEKIINCLAISIFEKNAKTKQRISILQNDVSFTISNNYTASVVRDELEKKEIPNQYTGNNKKIFKLSKADFIAFFMYYYDNIRFSITQNIKNRQETDIAYIKLFDKSKTLPIKVSEKIKDIDIIAVIESVGKMVTG